MSAKVKVVQSASAVLDNNEIAVEVLAQSIVDIAAGMAAIKKSRLNERALFVLLRDATGLSMTDLKRTLASLEQLEELFLKKKVTK